MERNWLIRTTQKQILGPVAKSKLLEFFHKGALSTNDEVSSGNGYWFSLKEKDLVEKYLLGDVPQDYNPVSESKCVLAKRENPDKTTSLNSGPVNDDAQVSKESLSPGIIPSSTDLEYPDAAASATTSISNLETKLPASEDLEFPDISLITESVNNSMKVEINYEQSEAKKDYPASIVTAIASNEPMAYPEDDDLAYPDTRSRMNIGIAALNIAKDDLDFKIERSKADVGSPKVEVKKSVSKDFKNEFEHDSGLSLDLSPPRIDEKQEKDEPVTNLSNEKGKDKIKHLLHNIDDKKLLHERKAKTSPQLALPTEVMKALPEELPRSVLPEHLKKRNDNYLVYVLIILILIILSLFFYYYRTILNKPLPV